MGVNKTTRCDGVTLVLRRHEYCPPTAKMEVDVMSMMDGPLGTLGGTGVTR